jgi:gas vesicle protein
MKSGKLITGLAIGTVVALILIPKTRKMISDAVCDLTDSFKDMMGKASDAANGAVESGKQEVNKFADKAKDTMGSAKAAKDAWQA